MSVVCFAISISHLINMRQTKLKRSPACSPRQHGGCPTCAKLSSFLGVLIGLAVSASWTQSMITVYYESYKDCKWYIIREYHLVNKTNDNIFNNKPLKHEISAWIGWPKLPHFREILK